MRRLRSFQSLPHGTPNSYWDRAIEPAETISDPFARNNTFAEIAAASITNGASDYADALLEMIDDPGTRSVAIEEIAVQCAELGDLDKSRTSFAQDSSDCWYLFTSFS